METQSITSVRFVDITVRQFFKLKNYSLPSKMNTIPAIQTCARDLWASASRAATVATPFKTEAAFSHVGVKAWQWPHHGAKNSTNTTPLELRTCKPKNLKKIYIKKIQEKKKFHTQGTNPNPLTQINIQKLITVIKYPNWMRLFMSIASSNSLFYFTNSTAIHTSEGTTKKIKAEKLIASKKIL